MMVGLLLDCLVAGLLATTIVFCFLLHRRLAVLRDAQAEMAELIAQFNTAADRAKSGVDALKQATAAAGSDLQSEIRKARAMTDELMVMAESGERLAERLEQGIGAARVQSAPSAKSEANRTGGGAADDRARSDAERELMQALRQTR